MEESEHAGCLLLRGFSGMLAHVVECVFQAAVLSFRLTRYHTGTENDKSHLTIDGTRDNLCGLNGTSVLM